MKKIVLMLSTVLLAQLTFAKGIEINDAYARATVGQKTSGAFVKLKNTGHADDVLVSAEVAKNVADLTELHVHINDNGTMRMREVKGGIPLPAGKTQELKPGGYHIMFFGLKHDLKGGTSLPVTLKFKYAPEQVVNFTVREVTEAHNHKHHHGVAHHH